MTQCDHGQLARTCGTCELEAEAEVARLRGENLELLNEMDAIVHALEIEDESTPPHEAIADLRAKLEAAKRDTAAIRAHVQGCVDAAYAEGLAEQLPEYPNEPGSLRDLVERRLLYVTNFDAAMEAGR